MNGESKRNISDFAGVGVKIGNQNKEKILDWLMTWGWTTERVIQKLIGVSRRPCSDYVARGLLQKIEPPRGYSPVYIIGQAFLREARQRYESKNGFVLAYPWPKTKIPFASRAQHNEEAQLCAIKLLAYYEQESLIKSEREIKSQFVSGQKGAIPDFVQITESDVIWHEVERNGKYHEKLYFQLQERNEALKSGKFTWQKFWCYSKSDAIRIKETLERKVIPFVIRREDGRYICDTSREGWDPNKLLQLTVISVDDEIIHEHPWLILRDL